MSNVRVIAGVSVLTAILASVFVLLGLQVKGGIRIGFWAVGMTMIPITTALLAVALRRLRGE